VNIGMRHADRWRRRASLRGITRLSQVGMKDDKTWALLENTKLYPMFAAPRQGRRRPYAPDKEAADHVKELGGDIKFHTLEGRARTQGGDPQGSVADELEAFVTTKKRNPHPRR